MLPLSRPPAPLLTNVTSYNELEETVVLHLGKQVSSGEIKIDLSYTGMFNDNLEGFYQAHYTSEDSNDKEYHLAVTFMEPTYARQVGISLHGLWTHANTASHISGIPLFRRASVQGPIHNFCRRGRVTHLSVEHASRAFIQPAPFQTVLLVREEPTYVYLCTIIAIPLR
jgi:hypothetical protein